MKLAKLILAFSIALCLAACSTTAHYPVNPPINSHDPLQDYRFRNLNQQQTSNSLGVMLTFSGGGTRAAALSHGVLEALANIQIQWDGKQRALLDEIDLISAVSGGSITAAHYALRHEKHFPEFQKDFLYQDLQTHIIDRIFSLEILSQLYSDYFGRIEVFAEKMDKYAFHGATYGDLRQLGTRPFIILNATDMSSGARFPFTQEHFDLICADLNSIPLARAVAASSAIPILFSPLTLNNYASQCTRPIHALLARDYKGLTPRQQRRLQELRSYRDDKRRPYIHLVDGGLVDNMAVWGGMESTVLTEGIVGLTKEMGMQNLKKVLFVLVSAETDPSLEADLSPKVPSLRRVAQAYADIPINHNSLESLILFEETIKHWQSELKRVNGHDIQFYLVKVSLRDIADAKKRDYFMQIPTTLGLPKENVDRLREQGKQMVRESPEMQRFMRDTKGRFIQSETFPADR